MRRNRCTHPWITSNPKMSGIFSLERNASSCIWRRFATVITLSTAPTCPWCMSVNSVIPHTWYIWPILSVNVIFDISARRKTSRSFSVFWVKPLLSASLYKRLGVYNNCIFESVEHPVITTLCKVWIHLIIQCCCMVSMLLHKCNYGSRKKA